MGMDLDSGPLPMAELLRSPVGGWVATGAAMLAESAGGNQDDGVLAGGALDSVRAPGTSGTGGVLSQAASKGPPRARTVQKKG
jgi:hypothetical protein